MSGTPLRRVLSIIDHARVIARLRRALHDDQPFVLVIVEPQPGTGKPSERPGYVLRNTRLDVESNADPVTLVSVLEGVIEGERESAQLATAPSKVRH